ncbi:MAG: glycerophosphoryl diester phosphodiesterase membrane domain-containing protein [Solobacterium sp.]|nr:glycerophosphoryl diester phosphodiesterase membrane domain-containing protein [Solobacterium sp.]
MKSKTTMTLKEHFESFWKRFVLFLQNMLLFFRQGFKQIMLFSLFCMVLSFLVTAAMDYLIPKLFSLTAGISFLNQGNGLQVATSPTSIYLLLLYLIISSFLSLFEIAGLIYAYSMIQIGRDVSTAGMAEAGWRICLKTLKPKNWLIFLFLVVLFPLTGYITLSSSGMKLSIPYFILQGIYANPTWKVMFNVGYTLLLAIELTYIFSINFYVQEDIDFITACKKSRRLIKDNWIRTLFATVLLVVGMNIILNTISAAIPANITEAVSFFSDDISVTKKSISLGSYVYVVRTILRALIAPVIYNAGLTVMFFTRVEDQNKLGDLSPHFFNITWTNEDHFKRGVKVMIGLLIFTTLLAGWHYRFLKDPVDAPIVCAHRGDNTYAPENTLESITLALNENTPWVEVDVFQAKDGTIVCTHDESLKRVTGHDVKVTELTYDEILQYEMLDSMPGTYEHVKVPTLESVIQEVKTHNAFLQIELKANGNESGFEQSVVDLVNKYDMKDQVLIISLKAYLIENIKNIEPDLPAAVCAFMAWENYRDYPYAEHLSLTDSAVTPSLVKTLHDNGIKVLTWTVDNEDDVQYLVSCDVDVIGTNDPLTIVNAIERADKRGGIFRLYHILLNHIAALSR